MSRRRQQRGSSTLEFSLVGVPLIFILISVANMSFGMMTLHTMQEAVEQGARFVITHGATCSSGNNTCGATVGGIYDVIAASAPGISPSSLTINLITNAGVATLCDASHACHGLTTPWPPSSDNAVGKDIIITADYTFASPIAMFWPGVGSQKFATTTFHAYSRQRLMF